MPSKNQKGPDFRAFCDPQAIMIAETHPSAGDTTKVLIQALWKPLISLPVFEPRFLSTKVLGRIQAKFQFNDG